MAEAPVIISEDLFKGLKELAWAMVPKRRKILLVFEAFKTKDINVHMEPLDGDTKIPPLCILFALRTINFFRYQPIGTIFFYKSTAPGKIANCIRAYIEDLKKCEFVVIGTICSAQDVLIPIVNSLVQVDKLKTPTSAHVYTVGPVKDIVHIYDPSTLLKMTRDKFLEGEVHFQYKDKTYNACYKDLDGSVRHLPIVILTKNLNAKGEARENTTIAAQLFSETVYNHILLDGNEAAQDTSIFCLFFDKLFDSFNTFQLASHKLRRVVRVNSKHYVFWGKAIATLKSMRFIKHENKESLKKVFQNSKRIPDAFEPEMEGVTMLNYKKSLPRHLGKAFRTSLKIDPTSDEAKFRDLIVDLLKVKCAIESGCIKFKSLKKPGMPRFKVCKSYKFQETPDYYHPKFLDCWIVSIRGMQLICKRLLTSGHEMVLTKTFNVDVLYNLTEYIKVFINGMGTEKKVQDIFFRVANRDIIMQAFQPYSCLTIR